MSFFDNLGKVISNTGKQVKKQTKDVFDTSQWNRQLLELEKKKKDLFYDLGEAYYALHCQDEDADCLDFIHKLNDIDFEMCALKERITQTKGVVECPSCGQQNPLYAKYCNHCGQSIIKDAEKEEEQCEEEQETQQQPILVTPIVVDEPKEEAMQEELEPEELVEEEVVEELTTDEEIQEEDSKVEDVEDQIEVSSAEESDVDVQEERHCPSCDAVVPDDDAYCFVCGSKLDQDSSELVDVVVEEEVKERRCPNCNHVLEEDDVYCTACGVKL